MDSEKYSRRRRRRTTERSTAGFFGHAAGSSLALALALAAAPSPVFAEEEPPGVVKLNRFLDTVDTLTAEFGQEVYDADEALLEEAAGSFALARPERFIWRYRDPYEQVVLADGEQLWMYDVELEQATVSPLEEGAGSPAMLLSGRAAVLETFDIASATASSGLDWVRLEPKASGTDFQRVAIGFDAEGLPRELEFVNALDQVTHIRFSDIVVNEALDEDVFELELPDDVEVIGRQGRR